MARRLSGWVLALFFVILGAVPALAQWDQVGNKGTQCSRIPEFAGNRPENADLEPCQLWDGSTGQVQIYYPLIDGTDADLKPDDLREIRTAVEHSLSVFRDHGLMPTRPQPPIYIWVNRSKPPTHILADTNFHHYSAGAFDPEAACLINVYWATFLQRADNRPRLPETIAHEVFHCVQFSQLEMRYSDDIRWWMEGSANWASNLAYPTGNDEQRNTTDFDQAVALTDQCGLRSCSGGGGGVYSTSLFFQDMDNHRGAGAVWNFLKAVLPTTKAEQQRNIADFPDADQIMLDFARDYVDGQIRDTGGGNVRQPEVQYEPSAFVDRDQEIAMPLVPLAVRAVRMRFDQGRTYQISGPGEGYRFSVKTEDGGWSEGDGPVTINAGCAEVAATLVLTSADATQAVGDVTFRASVTNDNPVCECQCHGQVPACVVGDWHAAEAPQLDLFVNNAMNVAKAGRNRARFENGHAQADSVDINLHVARNGDFTNRTRISYSGSGTINGTDVSMRGGISSTTQGQVCNGGSGRICVRYTSTTDPVPMSVTAMGVTIPFASSGGTYDGALSMPYECSGSSLTLRPTMQGNGPVPTQELTINYAR